MVIPIDKERMIEVSPSRSDPRHGKAPDDRSMGELMERGIIVLDKPRGPTSHQVVSWVKNILGIAKAGHHGTLDPNTTGVLPIALGGGVRLLESTLGEGKEYIAIMRLHSEVPQERLERIAREFTGEVFQMVPVRAAVKRTVRRRRIHHIKVIQVKGRDALLLIGCESGTYIRTLIHDMGEVLGAGANMTELRRTRSGRMSESMAVTLQQVKDAFEVFREKGDETALRRVVLPYETLIEHLPAVLVKDSTVDALCHGAPLCTPGLSSFDQGIRKGDLVAVYTLKGEVVALGEAALDAKGLGSARNGVAATVKRVVMDPGTYPRQWKTHPERERSSLQ